MRYHCRTDVKCIDFRIWRHMIKVGRHVSDLTSIVSKSRNQQTTKWWDLGQSQSWANEAKRRRAVDWIEYTPVPSYLYLDLRIYLFSCILTPWKRLKLLLNLFYSCKIALKIFFPRGTEAVGRRQEYGYFVLFIVAYELLCYELLCYELLCSLQTYKLMNWFESQNIVFLAYFTEEERVQQGG